MSALTGKAASDEMRAALLRVISTFLDSVMFAASGKSHGYGLSGDDLESVRRAMKGVGDTLAGAEFTLVRPDIFESIRKHMLERETAEKYEEACRDHDYLDNFRHGLMLASTRTGWKATKKLRAEVEALYKPESRGTP